MEILEKKIILLKECNQSLLHDQWLHSNPLMHRCRPQEALLLSRLLTRGGINDIQS